MNVYDIPSQEYFDYLLTKIRGPDKRVDRYGYLCRILYCKDFYYTMVDDGNRVAWAQTLRDNYLMEFDRTPEYLPSTPISCLELLISISIELERMVHDFRYGDRTFFWFFVFVENLGLDIYDDNKFPFYSTDFMYINNKLDIWMSRKYLSDGNNGNIIRLSTSKDLSKTTIAEQLNLFSSILL